MDLQFPAPRDFFAAIRASWFDRLFKETTFFADALETWLYELPVYPAALWPDRFDEFVAEQESAGRILSSDSRQEIINYLDDWAASLRPTELTVVIDKVEELDSSWPERSDEARARTRAEYGLPGWYAAMLEWGDAEWEDRFEALGRTSRDRMLQVCRELSVLGNMANEPDKLADDGLEELAAQRLRVLAAHDAYVLSLIDIQAKWLAYIKQHSFIGPQIQKLILKLEGALPPRLFDLTSQHSKALATIANDVNKALGEVVSRVDTAYEVAKWTDRVITAIEVATAVGAIGAGAYAVFKVAAEKGARAVAVRMAIRYAAKQLAVQATAYVAAGYGLPPLLAASGLNQDFVFTGLMVVQGLGMLHAVRSAQVARGPLKPGPDQRPDVDLPDGAMRDAPSPPKSAIDDPPSPSPDPADSARSIAKFIRKDYWKRTIVFGGLKVFQNDDLIDPKLVAPDGRTNLERMQIGFTPYGPDGKKIALHHWRQRRDGPLFEVTRSFHEKHSKYLHPHGNKRPSEIDRDDFKDYREDYWKHRANDFIKDE